MWNNNVNNSNDKILIMACVENLKKYTKDALFWRRDKRNGVSN